MLEQILIPITCSHVLLKARLPSILGEAETIMSTQEERNLELDMEIFKVVTDHLKQDTAQFWIRADFYLVALTGLLSAFALSYNGLRQQVGILRVIPILGVLASILWFVVMRNSIKWIQMWREQVVKLDEELDRFRCYAEVESQAIRKPFSSPSYLTQFLPLTFILAWVAVSIFTFLS
jgi:hypothetical protein